MLNAHKEDIFVFYTCMPVEMRFTESNLKIFISKNIFKDSADSPAFGLVFFPEESSTLEEYERNLMKLQGFIFPCLCDASGLKSTYLIFVTAAAQGASTMPVNYMEV